MCAVLTVLKKRPREECVKEHIALLGFYEDREPQPVFPDLVIAEKQRGYNATVET